MRVIAFITGVPAARAILAHIVEPNATPRDPRARSSALKPIA